MEQTPKFIAFTEEARRSGPNALRAFIYRFFVRATVRGADYWIARQSLKADVHEYKKGVAPSCPNEIDNFGELFHKNSLPRGRTLSAVINELKRSPNHCIEF